MSLPPAPPLSTPSSNLFLRNYCPNDGGKHSLNYEIGQSDLLRQEGVHLYKMSYSSELEGHQGNHTRYFIDVNKQTFDVQVVNNEEEDFEYSFKNIQIN